MSLEPTDEELYKALARKRLHRFAKRVDPGYVVARHVRFVCRALEAMERGEIRHLIVLIPPRHGKTRLVSQIFPAWWLGRHPKHELIMASNTEDLASDNSMAARNIIAGDVYPFRTKIHPDSSAKSLWRTTEGGVVRAVGVGSAVQGRGGNLLLIDDPVKGVDDATELAFERQWRWFVQDFFPRRLTESHVVVSMFCWDNEDLAGRIINHDDPEFRADWTVVRLPAYAEEDDPLGRAVGEVLWEPSTLPDGRKVGYGREFLEQTRRADSTGRAWSAQYELDPQPAGGKIFSEEMFVHRYARAPVGRTRVMSIDGAWKTGIKHSRSAIATWTGDLEKYYILDMWAGRLEYPDLVNQVKAKVTEQRPDKLIVEDKASGTPLVQELARWLPKSIELIAISPGISSKETRAEATTKLFKNGDVLLPEGAPWLEDWIKEHLRFPGKPNDQVDTTSLALTWMHEKVEEERARIALERQRAEWSERNQKALRGWMIR